MSAGNRKRTIILAGLVLASLPLLVMAQTPRRQGTTTRQNQTHADQNSPRYHLDEAKRVLNSINVNAMKGESRTQLTELRTHFNQLESAWRSHMPATGHTPETTARGTAGTTGAGDWMTHYSAIDQILDKMSGANARLMEFKKHLDAFHLAAMSASGTPRSAIDRDVTDAPDNVGAQKPGFDPDVQQDPNAPRDVNAQRDPNATIRVAPGQTIELSAPGTADSATVARLSAMIDEMLRARATANPTGTTGSATAGTVCVDRAKLEQLRTVIDGLRSPQQ